MGYVAWLGKNLCLVSNIICADSAPLNVVEYHYGRKEYFCSLMFPGISLSFTIIVVHTQLVQLPEKWQNKGIVIGRNMEILKIKKQLHWAGTSLLCSSCDMP